jgi:hypothetical protein
MAPGGYRSTRAAGELAALPDAMHDPFSHRCYPVEISASLQALPKRVDSIYRQHRAGSVVRNTAGSTYCYAERSSSTIAAMVLCFGATL